MRIRNWKLKSLSKAIASLTAFTVFVLLLNHSYPRKLFSEQALGNYEPKDVYSREGAGEMGRPHYTRDDQKEKVRAAFTEYGINLVASSEISLSRSLPDLRHSQCKYWQYSENLPSASIVIVLYNEGLSLILRNINSILQRTPRQILEEIILVDDFSDKTDLRLNLETHVEKYGGVVKLVRNKERQGLIRSRVTGAKKARGQVLVFLDAHCEVTTNWLPPLLEPIKRKPRVVTVPIIDGIDKNTFQYESNYNYERPSAGIFSWGMLYKEITLSTYQMQLRANVTSPHRTATHQGGLLAIRAAYFQELGYYDEGLLLWGAEHLELSFKVWQCGGTILWVPCSRVGHVFRTMPDRTGAYKPARHHVVTSNYKRVVETWLDPRYKEYYYTMNPLSRYVDMGDITAASEVKLRLKCRSFAWYMEYVAGAVYTDFPPPPVNLHWGELVNGATAKCVSNVEGAVPGDLGTSVCFHKGASQIVRLNAEGQLGMGERCIVGDSGTLSIRIIFCTLGKTDGPWFYDEKDMILINTDLHKCMGQHPMTRRLMLIPCDGRNTYLQWTFKELRA